MYILYGVAPPKSYTLLGKISEYMNFQPQYKKCKVPPETLKYLRVILLGAVIARLPGRGSINVK